MLRNLFLAGIGLLTASGLQAQSVAVYTPPVKKAYWSTSGEWIFSMPILDVNGSDQGSVVRFSPFFNAQGMLNYDLSEQFGLFTGLSIRNQGFIYDVPGDSLNRRYKYRTYNVGVPVGIKAGRMNGALFFAGYEFEMPFNYKEKFFENERKEDKFNVWFSDRNEQFYQSVFAGVQGPGSVTLTVRYYLTNFHNQDFTESREVNGVSTKVKPYDGLNCNLLTVSLGYALFDGRKMEFTRGDQPDPRAMR
jgi:hypothetical protein